MNPNQTSSAITMDTKDMSAKMGDNPEQSPYYTPKPNLTPDEIKEKIV